MTATATLTKYWSVWADTTPQRLANRTFSPMHVVSTPGMLSSSVNPHSCLYTGTQQLTWDVTGGTGQFDDVTGSFTGTVSAVALLARNPDGSCSFTQFPRHEVDKFAESGTLSF